MFHSILKPQQPQSQIPQTGSRWMLHASLRTQEKEIPSLPPAGPAKPRPGGRYSADGCTNVFPKDAREVGSGFRRLWAAATMMA